MPFPWATNAGFQVLKIFNSEKYTNFVNGSEREVQFRWKTGLSCDKILPNVY